MKFKKQDFTKFLAMLSLVVGFTNCSTAKTSLEKDLKTPFYNNHFTGILIFDPETKDTLFSHNANKYFTPASNTKIATLYTALKILPEHIPSFKYSVKSDTAVIKGMGDPTFLHPYFKDSTAYDVLQESKHIQIVDNFNDTKLGPGWAWEDYDAYFNVERTAFPMYGNVLRIERKDSVTVEPKIFRKSVKATADRNGREYLSNQFYYKAKDTSALEIPMLMDSTVQKMLWKDLFPGKDISFIKDDHRHFIMTIHSIASDSVFKRMMWQSDNFLAEQLLVLSAATKFDTLDTRKIRTHILNNELSKLKHPPRWVDGSGLSRYNLFTPDSFVFILNELYQELPRERLLHLFPVGGVSGTLKSSYAGNPEPYVYAKSGTVGNNYSLSGYLITKSGKMLIFSMMNNHYLKPTSDIRDEVQRLLEFVRDHY